MMKRLLRVHLGVLFFIVMGISISAFASNRILLNVEGYQQTTNVSCSAASSLMILNYFECTGMPSNDSDYFNQILGSSGNYNGLVDNMNYFLKQKEGIQPYELIVDCPTLSDFIAKVRSSLEMNRPVIVSYNRGAPGYVNALKKIGSCQKSSVGHYSVLIGIDGDDSTAVLYIKDPSLDKNAIVEITASDFYSSMPYSGIYNNGIEQSNGNKHPIIYGVISCRTDTSPIFYESSTYRIIKDRDIKREPYEESESMGSLGVGDTVHVKYAVKNDYSNLWFKLATGGYVYSGYTVKEDGSYEKAGDQYLEFLSDDASVSWDNIASLQNKVFPQPQSFELMGNITSSNPIKRISVEVRTDGMYGPNKPLGEVSFSNRAYSFNIYNSVLNTGVKFTSMTANKNYNLVYKVTYATQVGSAEAAQEIIVPFSIGNVPADATAPVVSDIAVSNITSSGYTVSCTVTDDVGVTSVKFPTWTVPDDQDDLVWHEGIINGTTATFTVKTSGHGNQKGCQYITDIYAYDAAGNSGNARAEIFVPVDVNGIELSQSVLALEAGSSATLTAVVSPADAGNQSVTWSSSNAAVATVSASGVVTAKGNGTAVISCTTVEGGHTASCTVTVTTKVTGVSLNEDMVTLKAGEAVRLTATITPASASNRNVSWSSSDSAVAAVSADGSITAVGQGTAVISCTTADGVHTASCVVLVIAPVNLGDDFYALIRHVDSGKLVDAAPAVQNANVELASEKFDESQLWHFVRQSAGYYKIYKGIFPMEVYNAASANNTNIQLYLDHAHKAQYWYIQENGTGYRFTPDLVWSSCLDVAGNGSADGTNIQLYQQHDAPGPQCFAIEKCIPVTSLNLNYASLQFEYTGMKENLIAVVEPSNATYQDVVWSSDDEAVATVEDGVVIAQGSGAAVITCATKDGKYTAECVVTVESRDTANVFVTGVKLGYSEDLDFDVGMSFTLVPQIWPSNATNQTVYWESSDESVATVSETGVVTMKGSGKAVITCTTEDGGHTDSCTFIVSVPVTDIQMDIESAELLIGDTLTLNPTVLPANASNKELRWYSEDTSIATVSDSGEVYGVGYGVVCIYCEAAQGGIRGRCVVYVKGIDIEEWYVECDRTVLEAAWGIANTSKIRCVYRPEDAFIQSITWTSSNPEVATVDADGNITAISGGTARITCAITCNGGTADWDTEIHVLDSVLTLPEAMATIEDNAFIHNDALRLVAFPEGKVTIGEYAFRGCLNIAYAYFPGMEAEIAENAFFQCDNMTFICHPGSDAQAFAESHGIEVWLIEE